MTSIPAHGPAAVPLGRYSPDVTSLVIGPWARQARCADVPDPDIFFPRHDDPGTKARQLCQACPVRDACLTFAITNDERHGIWGVLDPAERAALRRKLRRGRRVPGKGAA